MCWARGLWGGPSQCQCHCPGRALSRKGAGVTTQRDGGGGLRRRGADVGILFGLESRKIRESSPGKEGKEQYSQRREGPKQRPGGGGGLAHHGSSVWFDGILVRRGSWEEKPPTRVQEADGGRRCCARKLQLGEMARVWGARVQNKSAGGAAPARGNEVSRVRITENLGESHGFGAMEASLHALGRVPGPISQGAAPGEGASQFLWRGWGWWPLIWA